MTKKVLIIGLGLIGGSIALAIKKAHPDADICGYDVNEEQLRLAAAGHVIDRYEMSLDRAAPDSDLIVISVPVLQTEEIIDRLAGLPLKKDALITDVGSTKQRIMEQAAIFEDKAVFFVGGHPMAGSHKSGVSAARAHLFENAYYILTAAAGENEYVYDRMEEWLKGTGAKFLRLNPEEHDYVAGAISHFPHIVAAGLVHQIEKLNGRNALVARLAAGGFRDITRIASSSPVMWRDILVHNRDALLSMFEDWKREMTAIEKMVAEGDSESIHNYFKEAKGFRDSLPSRTKGAIPSYYDLYVDVPDYPGIISTVTGILAREELNITNLRILETREDILGVLRISFRSDEDRSRSQKLLRQNGYDTFIES
ncbi:prephenate dehydrogenase [Bacillus marinisedimentorum]|uniref:prephenate dehydrogenase n=1 Tax=Bacillus marinisedimentorum TaxID=1821260 RepID=UPI000872E3AD|nr:prephenate dehydrogenase [Bacillus marinisedimentorum]